MKNLLLVILSLISIKAIAISEDNYQENFNKYIVPFVKTLNEGMFKSNNLNIHYRSYLSEKSSTCLIILPGRSESAEKYGELIYDLVQTDFGRDLNYFIMDHRGQGSSDRMNSKLDMGYVDHFENYTLDLDLFLQNIVSRAHCSKKFLFAHSMGAGIALSYISTHENAFDAMAISSPMLKILTKPYSYAVAKTIVNSMIAIGRGDEFAIGQKGYSSNDEFATNKFTTSKVRFEMSMDLFETYPKTKLGGVSNKWIHEIMKGTSKLRSSYKSITSPMRVFIAGNELYSEPLEMKKLCVEALNCDEVFLPTSKHEVINDRDENRKIVIDSMIDLFSKN